MASFRGRGEWLVRRSVRAKMWPRGTVEGTVNDMVRPAKGGDVVVVVVREVGRLSLGGVVGREFAGLSVLAIEGKARLLGRATRCGSCEDGPKRVFRGMEKSTLLRQCMEMAGLQVLEISRVDSRTMSRRPTVLGEADGRGSGFST